MTNSGDRLDQIEALLSETAAITRSNAKAIESLSNGVAQLVNESRLMQREALYAWRRIDDNTADIRDIQADIRDLVRENQRILRYLESKNHE